MTTEAHWPVLNPRSLSRRCTGAEGVGGGGREAVWDHTALMRTMRGNLPAVARVARAFLDDCPRVVQRLRDAVRDGDRPAVQQFAHRLKGNAGILRAGRVRDAAERLERVAEQGGQIVAPQLLALEQALARLCESLSEFLAESEESVPS